MTSQNEKAEDLMRRIEREEEQVRVCFVPVSFPRPHVSLLPAARPLYRPTYLPQRFERYAGGLPAYLPTHIPAYILTYLFIEHKVLPADRHTQASRKEGT